MTLICPPREPTNRLTASRRDLGQIPQQARNLRPAGPPDGAPSFTQPGPRSRPARAAESTAKGMANSSHPQRWDHTSGSPADGLASTPEAFAGHSCIVCLIVRMFEAAARRRRASG